MCLLIDLIDRRVEPSVQQTILVAVLPPLNHVDLVVAAFFAASTTDLQSLEVADVGVLHRSIDLVRAEMGHEADVGGRAGLEYHW